MPRSRIALLAAAFLFAWAGTRAEAGAAHDLKLADRTQPAEAAATPVAAAAKPAGWIDWNGDNFFGPCAGDCSVAVHGGRQVVSPMSQVFFERYPAIPVWKWTWRDSDIVALSFSRRLATFWQALAIEPEFGVAQRFGTMHAAEFWGAVVVRWTEFPWNDYVRTTIALSEGVSVASKIDPLERALNDPKVTKTGVTRNASLVLNYFSPEITFGVPQLQSYDLFVRWHHRSGLFKTINGVNGAAQYATLGLRMHF